jgi:hypothetical protein
MSWIPLFAKDGKIIDVDDFYHSPFSGSYNALSGMVVHDSQYAPICCAWDA